MLKYTVNELETKYAEREVYDKWTNILYCDLVYITAFSVWSGGVYFSDRPSAVHTICDHTSILWMTIYGLAASEHSLDIQNGMLSLI